jgi:hypothetical protein
MNVYLGMEQVVGSLIVSVGLRTSHNYEHSRLKSYISFHLVELKSCIFMFIN